MPWKTVLAVTALLAAVVVGLGFWHPFRKSEDTLRIPGVVEIQEVRLGSKIGGRVEETLIQEGELAEPGRVLVRLEVPELKAQKEQQEARVLQAKADLERARNGPRPQEIREAEMDLETAEADRTWTKLEFARVQKLREGGASAQSEYESAVANRDRALGREGAARAKLDLLNAGTREEEKTMALGRYQEAVGKLHELEANLAEAVVKAPERVLIEVLGVRNGDLVTPNQPLIRVLRAADLWVKVYVPETDLGKVWVDQPVTVTIDSYPDRRFAGKVYFVAAESEFTPRNIQSVDERRHQVFGVKIRVEDAQKIFKSGMAAEVVFSPRP